MKVLAVMAFFGAELALLMIHFFADLTLPLDFVFYSFCLFAKNLIYTNINFRKRIEKIWPKYRRYLLSRVTLMEFQ
jgi:hypothetical protein